MQITLRHTYRIELNEPVFDAVLALRATASQFDGQDIETWNVVAPGLETAPIAVDGFGNVVRLISLPHQQHEIVVQISGKVDRTDTFGMIKGLAEPCRPHVYLRTTELTEPGDDIAEKVSAISQDSPLAVMHAWNEFVHRTWAYERAVDPEVSKPKQKSKRKKAGQRGTRSPDANAAGADGALTDDNAIQSEGEAGVGNPAFKSSPLPVGDVVRLGCGDGIDLAHVFIAGARHLDLPARVVLGYLARPKIDEEPETNGDLLPPGRHAWAEVWIEGLGWVGFDPVLNQCPTDRYVRLSCALDGNGAVMLRSVPGLDDLGRVTETVELSLPDLDPEVDEHQSRQDVGAGDTDHSQVGDGAGDASTSDPSNQSGSQTQSQS
ncbi:MAG: transglutaminase family protein [Pseudomonadota bacterium]